MDDNRYPEDEGEALRFDYYFDPDDSDHIQQKMDQDEAWIDDVLDTCTHE